MSYINKIAIVLFALLHRLIKDKKVKNDVKNILILFHEPGIGDIVCSLDLIKKLKLVYPENEGYKIYLGVNNHIYDFLKSIHYVNFYEFIILNIDLDDRCSFSLFLKNYNKLNKIEWESIVSFERIGPYLKSLILGLATNHYYLTEFESQKGKKNFDSLLNTLLNNLQMYFFKDSEMLFLLFEKAIMKFTGKQIYIDAPEIGIVDKFHPLNEKRKYCIVCCGIKSNHAYPFRSWPLERFAKVIEFIKTNYDLDVYLCGNTEDIEKTNNLLNYLDNTNNVLNLVGKTSFNQWIELTRNAEFVFGNDSGYIHLAAAVGTQAFVLMGFWNYGRFFPYQLTKKKVNYKKPVLIKIVTPDCSFCRLKQSIQNNPKAQIAKEFCDGEVERNGVYKCINDIRVEDVREIINAYYNKFSK